MSEQKEEYLGDGLYARFDKWDMLILRAQRDEFIHWVALEPEVYDALVAFVARVRGETIGAERIFQRPRQPDRNDDV